MPIPAHRYCTVSLEVVDSCARTAGVISARTRDRATKARTYTSSSDGNRPVRVVRIAGNYYPTFALLRELSAVRGRHSVRRCYNRRSHGRTVPDRQDDAEDRASRRARLSLHAATRARDDGADDREAKPKPLGLRRDEGFEKALAIVRSIVQ